MAPADFTATNGTSIVLASSANLNDVLFVVTFGTFQVADLGTALTADLNIQGNKITGSAVSLDSSGDITLDAGGADILISDDGTEIGRFTNSSSDAISFLEKNVDMRPHICDHTSFGRACML